MLVLLPFETGMHREATFRPVKRCQNFIRHSVQWLFRQPNIAALKKRAEGNNARKQYIQALRLLYAPVVNFIKLINYQI